jgi:hypothetical protein
MRAAHGKEYLHGKVSSGARKRSCARQRPTKARGKENYDGKDPTSRTVNIGRTAMALDGVVSLPLQ